MAKTTKQKNSLEQAIDHVTSAFGCHYISLVQERIDCLEELFGSKLDQIMNCLGNSDKAKLQKHQEKSARNPNHVTGANQVDIPFPR